MKKHSFLALIVAIMMVISACSTSAGLLLKEATIKQVELESFEGKSTLSVNIDTASMKDTFEIDVDTKQVDLLNSAVDIHIGHDLLTLAGIQLEPDVGNKVILSFISKDGDSIISTPQDDIGIELATFEETLDELGEGKEEAFDQLIVNLQDTFRELIKQYLKDFNYSLRQIENHGNVTLELPNGQNVETRHIEVQLTALDAIDMLQYSLNYFLENESFQDTLYEAIANLPAMMVDFAEMDEVDSGELQIELDTIKAELNTAIEGFVKDLESVKTELTEYEEIISDLATVSFHSYIGIDDKETYQTEFILQVSYKEEMANLNLEGLDGIPFTTGDSITISSKDQIWNHNKTLDPIDLPSKLLTMDDLMEVESIDEFKEIVGKETILAQLADYLGPLFEVGQYGFVDLYLDENKAYTMNGEVDVHMYVKDGQLMAPLRFVGEEMGADVTWLENTRQIIVKGNDHLLDVDVAQNNVITFDGEKRSDLLSEVKDGTSYINVRPFAEAMGWSVLWDEETKSTFIF